MRPLLFWNKSDTEGFFEVGAVSGAPCQQETVGRGAAVADYDRDGDLDLLVVNHGAEPWLLRNQGGTANRWLRVRVRGKHNRFGVGARVKAVINGQLQVQQIGAQPSYCSQNGLVAHFGVGAAEHVDRIAVTFPNGKTVQREQVATNQAVEIQEE